VPPGTREDRSLTAKKIEQETLEERLWLPGGGSSAGSGFDSGCAANSSLVAGSWWSS